MAPKHHFGNKDGLLAAIAASGFRDLTEFRFSRLKAHMNAEQRLRVLLSSYVVFGDARSGLSPDVRPAVQVDRGLHGTRRGGESIVSHVDPRVG